MTSALINGFTGLTLSFWIGVEVFDFSPTEVLFFVLISNIAGLIALLSTLRAEQNSWLKKHLLNHFLKTWSFLAILYFGILLTFCPPLRDPKTLLCLALPLILSYGFGILAFGPIQDAIVRRGQKKTQVHQTSLEVESG